MIIVMVSIDPDHYDPEDDEESVPLDDEDILNIILVTSSGTEHTPGTRPLP